MAFEAVIVETMVPDWPLLDIETRAEAVRQMVAFVKASIAIAPFHVRLAVSIFSFMIGLLVVLVSIGSGGGSVRSARAEWLYGHLQSLPGPCGAVVRLYRSTSLVAFYEFPAVSASLMALPEHSQQD